MTISNLLPLFLQQLLLRFQSKHNPTSTYQQVISFVVRSDELTTIDIISKAYQMPHSFIEQDIALGRDELGIATQSNPEPIPPKGRIIYEDQTPPK